MACCTVFCNLSANYNYSRNKCPGELIKIVMEDTVKKSNKALKKVKQTQTPQNAKF